MSFVLNAAALLVPSSEETADVVPFIDDDMANELVFLVGFARADSALEDMADDATLLLLVFCTATFLVVFVWNGS